ncbi:hypothetical protein G7Y89_g14730 [Cudoniella acicularis]|uniref:DNA replication regulator Sld3 C-terminal domain-containing protein n=1 Tax=Cudoniella acicularis TaxID=354080 RepID=A0A8H4QYQ9_9HELO|nr:hypothetical protein G7Y89_g14730 [Cudoniella acicularis]
MLDQHELLVSDASAKLQTRSGILTPASDNSLNLSDGTSSSAKKRKRDGNTMEDLLRGSFTVKPFPATVSMKPRTLQPLLLLPRSSLPLAALDLMPSTNVLPQSRLFEAHVKILELEERMGSQPMMLIARLDDGRTLYAVEREDRGLHVLCRLGSWVNLQQLKDAAVVPRQELSKRSERAFGISAGLPNTAILIATSETSKYTKKKRLAIEAIQSMIKRPTTAMTESRMINPEPERVTESQSTVELVEPAVPEEPVSQPTAAEIFENVRTQYFEALYLSKASLAYFAKGPLSRARAAFHLDFDSALDMNDHVAFLESLIMSTTLLDKKYREGVPGCVSLIDIQGQSEDDVNGAPPKTKKRKSAKKMKPGKTGLYPAEETLIRRWWAGHDDDAESGGPGASKEELTKSRIAQLRIRETQLQMIMILEVLALQPLALQPEDSGEGLPSGLPTSNAVSEKEKPVKAKKPDHLSMLIDIHIDRLCIWQSIQLEAGKILSTESQTSTEKLDGSAPELRHTDNILRDFCIEVIAPFFSARLPDRCAVINRKLGGPVAVSPPKPRLSKSASFSGAQSRPGAATKRPVPAKPRRSLQRVLTDERERRSVSRGPERAMSLMRSATMPLVPGLKREVSEAPSLSGIPLADSQTLEANRGGVLNSKRFARREIDLGSLAPDANAKAKKKAIIDAELKEAISALKKPNRELAGKVLAETAEKRSAPSHPRKSKKPIRNPLFQGIQITATPKANRTNDVFAKLKHAEFPGKHAASDPVPSSAPRIPQSVSRENMPGRNPFLSSVQATPSRRSLSMSSQLLGRNDMAAPQDGCPPSSPLHLRRSSAQLFSSVPDSAIKMPNTPRMSRNIQETPIKKRPEINSVHGHPEPLFDGNKENVQKTKKMPAHNESEMDTGSHPDVSIYKSLGWDDVDDIDELS